MEQSIEEMNQKELVDFMNGTKQNDFGMKSLDIDNTEDKVRRNKKHFGNNPEKMTEDDYVHLMENYEYNHNGVVNLFEE